MGSIATSGRGRSERCEAFFHGKRVPESVASLFWDYPGRRLEMSQHPDLLIARVLCSGSWSSVRWLRSEVGDDAIRRWLERTEGRSLDRRGLRLWQVLLDLPAKQVDAWLADPRRQVWDRRSPVEASTSS